MRGRPQHFDSRVALVDIMDSDGTTKHLSQKSLDSSPPEIQGPSKTGRNPHPTIPTRHLPRGRPNSHCTVKSSVHVGGLLRADAQIPKRY
ncbi:hypothetical protein C2E23DRAFT_814146 [Lenzites betulinus]|nr:hypothetical protein C2E23DRAFT_814146 [Lenzites betulinus]